MPTEARAASDDSSTTLLPSAQHRQQLLHQKERRAHVDREQRVEVLDGRCPRCWPRCDAGVGDQNVEPFADDRAHLRGELMRRRRRAADRRRLLGLAAGGADFGDQRIGLPGAALP